MLDTLVTGLLIDVLYRRANPVAMSQSEPITTHTLWVLSLQE